LLIEPEEKNDPSVMFSERLPHATHTFIDGSAISHVIFSQVHHHYHYYQQHQQAIRMPFHAA